MTAGEDSALLFFNSIAIRARAIRIHHQTARIVKARQGREACHLSEPARRKNLSIVFGKFCEERMKTTRSLVFFAIKERDNRSISSGFNQISG
jgi:hypothetical protein